MALAWQKRPCCFTQLGLPQNRLFSRGNDRINIRFGGVLFSDNPSCSNLSIAMRHDDNKLADIWFWRWLDTLKFRMPTEVLIPKTKWKNEKGSTKTIPRNNWKLKRLIRKTQKKTKSKKTTEKQKRQDFLSQNNFIIRISSLDSLFLDLFPLRFLDTSNNYIFVWLKFWLFAPQSNHKASSMCPTINYQHFHQQVQQIQCFPFSLCSLIP